MRDDHAHDLFNIRWFTPEYELDLCGHGTLAAGFVVFNYLQPNFQQINLQSKKELLQVDRQQEFITLNFPVKNIKSVNSITLLSQGLGLVPNEVHEHKDERVLAVFDSEDQVKNIKPVMHTLRQLKYRGVTVTAKTIDNDDIDFVSRTFYPHKTISEDAATGASHCLLAPYWTGRLDKSVLRAQQLSARGGEMECEVKEDRVLIRGKAIIYARGYIYQ